MDGEYAPFVYSYKKLRAKTLENLMPVALDVKYNINYGRLLADK